MKNNNNDRLTPHLVAFIFAYVLMIGIMSSIHIMDVNVKFGKGFFSPSDLGMMLTMTLTVITLVNIVALREPAYMTAKILFVLHLSVVVMGLGMTGDTVLFLPAVLSVAFMFVISHIVYKHITTIERKERELHKIAYTDNLTNTPNRRAFNEMLDKLTKQDEQFALVYIDFNKFTSINETAGHEYGDMVLSEAVTRWKRVMNENDFISRLSGDEFALIVTKYGDNDSLIAHIAKFSQALNNKITIQDQSVFISASFGIALYPIHSKDGEELVRYADIAMQLSRVTGDSNIRMYEKSMTENVERSANIEKLMRKALAEDGFNLVFQPQYDTNDKKLRGFETLLRLNDEEGKPISPGLFIPLAEKNGMITAIDCYVLKKAMRTFKPMLEKYNKDLMLSVNISAVHLSKNSFLSDVENAVMETGFPARNLELEITESVFITSLDSAIETLNRVKMMGIQLALDDFGTGYASLSYLSKLPIDLLKIDKAFVDGLQKDDLTDFVAAIISMGHLMHFEVISEGVEYEDQLNKLRMLNCDFIQGFIWGRPMDIEAVDELLKTA
ncbi:MAG: EAL domain-containing protein [Firmicutes bacterium]|nr:EAL domain-containing protein [Bacillota bacterium]